MLNFLIQFRVRVNGQHIDANERWVKLIANVGSCLCSDLATASAGNTY